MNTRIKYLKDYVEEIHRLMGLFNGVNMDITRLYSGRMVRVSDSLGNVSCGYFCGFYLAYGGEDSGAGVDMYIRLQLPKKDGSPSNKMRNINCRDALFRLMGVGADKHPVIKKKRGWL